MLNFAHAVVPFILIFLGLLDIIVFGNPFERVDKAQIRSAAPAEIQKLYFENRQINTIIGVGMILAGFFIAHW